MKTLITILLCIVVVHMLSGKQGKNNPITLKDYQFTAPEGWVVENRGDHIFIQNPKSGCNIKILNAQVSSGHLEKDAANVFGLMYNGWQFQKTGRQQFTASKGNLMAGLPFYLMEATMGKLSADGTRYDGFEEGAAMVVKAGRQIVIIAVRHNSSLFAHDDCNNKYETWRRFFNSFNVKNISVPISNTNNTERIIGSWSQASAGETANYIFAANGKYALIGALGSASTSSDYRYEYLHIKTYAWKGDGSYSIKDNTISLKKYANQSAEKVQFRIESVNYGGTGWVDRLWLLKGNPMNEVSYDRN